MEKLKENQKLQLKDGSWVRTTKGDSIEEAREKKPITDRDDPRLKKYGIEELQDGLTLERLEKDFSWILRARISDAILRVDRSSEKLVWINGIWEKGTWYDGIWELGDWLNGKWKNGIRKWGAWFDGIWEDGIWEDGTFEGGVWKNGIWKRGVWKRGTWKNGTWKDGYFWGGFFNGGEWFKGSFSENATFGPRAKWLSSGPHPNTVVRNEDEGEDEDEEEELYFNDILPAKLNSVVRMYKLKTKRMIRDVASILEDWYDIEGMSPSDIETMSTKEFRNDMFDLLDASDLTDERLTVIKFLEQEDLYDE